MELDILKQSKFADHETDFIKNIASEKLHRQRNLKEIIALDELEKQFLLNHYCIFTNVQKLTINIFLITNDQYRNVKYKLISLLINDIS